MTTKKYNIYLNNDKSVYDISEDNKNYEKDFIKLDYEKTIAVLHLIKNKASNEIVVYKNKKFIITKCYQKLLSELRQLRNEKIALSDFYFLTDNVENYDSELLNEIKLKRKTLREITDSLNSVEDLVNAIELVKSI